MWDGEEGLTEKDEKPSTKGPSQELQETPPMPDNDPGDKHMVAFTDMDNEEDDEQEGANEAEQESSNQHSSADASTPTMQPAPVLNCGQKTTNNLQVQLESSSPVEQEPDVDPDFDIDPDPDGELEGDTQSESHPCLHCERRFSTRQGLERHVHIHAITNQQTQLFKCRYCNKPFGSQVGRRRHERRHESGPKKKPGSLAGTANLISHVGQTDVSSPDSTGQTNHFIAIGPQFAGGPLHNPEVQRAESSPQFDRPYMLEENGESKELHPCKYCNKAFGTHTNMRRHQRRIHERHLLPKGVRRKGMLLQETTQQQQPNESPSTSPPPVYVPSADTEDEADRDDYVVDISKNISENLSFYIDGKIVSSSTVSTCEVIEVDSRSAALFGLDTVIISPNQLSQAFKIEGRTNAAKSVSSIQQTSSKRRTSTPPLVPSLKQETETQSFTGPSSSTSSNLLVGGLFQQEMDPSHFQREKTVYLSPKLKQLLQTKDTQKTTITLLPESNNMASPLSVTPLQGASGRFKRRTSSPPSSPQHSPASKTESFKSDARGLFTLKVPKLESNFSGSFQDQEESAALSPSGDNHQLCPNSGGKSCTQQPLDLSSTVSRWNDTQINLAQGDSALDLSFHRKSSLESESKAPQPLAKKRKPNTSMLEKVLMNEYAGLSMAVDEGEGVSGIVNTSCNNSCSSNATSDSAHPSPPSLTPVTLNPSSPTNSFVTSPTPPPPVLPTIPSPPPNPDSPSSQPSDSSGQRPFPILSPEMSPRKEAEEDLSVEENEDKEDDDISEPPDSNPDTPVEESLNGSTSGSPQHESVDVPSTEDVSLTTSPSLQNGDTQLPEASDAAVSSQPKSPPASISPAPSPTLDNPFPPHSPPLIKVKEEEREDEVLVTSKTLDVVNSLPQSPAPTKLSNKPSDGGEMDVLYCKNFVCNVCEAPFNSMKELGVHITDHAADWAFKCEFCVQLFADAPALLSHRAALHGVGEIFVCLVCCKEFAFLCNLQQHQKDLHPNETCSHTTVENGKLRPQNYTDPSKAKEESSPSTPAPEAPEEASPQQDQDKLEDEPDVNGNHAEEEGEDPTEELYTTIKIMASESGKPKGPDVRLGINQHYPSYKPPPFPYHSRSHSGCVASATNFTTHNIPQTFTTAIRCTKCGNGFDNMPELHKHILACANASDKKRYTPKKNPIPLKQIVKSPNGVVSPSAAAGQSAFRRMGQPKRLNFGQDAGKTKLSALSKKKNQLVQKAISQKNKAASTAKKAVKVDEEPKNVCPHCNREFTYTASLTKHISISCPMKPVVKKDKKVSPEVKKEPAADKSMTLRKKASDTEQIEPDSKPLGKTRARSSGTADSDPSQTTKGKNARPAAPQKRPASSPQLDSTGKKQKKAQTQSLPPTPSVPDTPEDTAPRPASRMQRMGKVAAPKKVAEVKPPPLQQPKKEERFSLRTRERARGPVTRSLQTTAEDKNEESTIPEPKATQEVK